MIHVYLEISMGGRRRRGRKKKMGVDLAWRRAFCRHQTKLVARHHRIGGGWEGSLSTRPDDCLEFPKHGGLSWWIFGGNLDVFVTPGRLPYQAGLLYHGGH